MLEPAMGCDFAILEPFLGGDPFHILRESLDQTAHGAAGNAGCGRLCGCRLRVGRMVIGVVGEGRFGAEGRCIGTL